MSKLITHIAEFRRAYNMKQAHDIAKVFNVHIEVMFEFEENE